MTDSLHTKYRPDSLDKVIGQNHVVGPLRDVIERRDQHAFLFEGPSGTGKTTLARIVAKELGCDDVIEIDAASHTGVDAMREIAQRANYVTLGGGGKAFIIDECHRLSRQAWESLLKDIEEPPAGVFWMFCTTEGAKVIKAVQTRCMAISLREVPYRPLLRLVSEVAEAEGMSLPDDVLDAAAEAADGSPRQALVNLAAVRTAENASQAHDILSRIPAGKEAFNLAQMICKPNYQFADACKLLKELKDVQPETIRHTVRAYATTMVLNGGDRWARGVLLAFEKPAIDQNQISDILCRLITMEKWKK